MGNEEILPFSMAIGNEELVHACFPRHSWMGTARMNLSNKETEEESKKRGVSIKRSKVAQKKN